MLKMVWLGILCSLLFVGQAGALEIYGHRGARGLAPENTLVGYQTALKVGVDTVDMDVNMSKDGVLVVTHDYALNPNITRNQSGMFIQQKDILIKDLTFKQLETYDVGKINIHSHYAQMFPYQQSYPNTHIPTLRQVIDYVKLISGDKVHFQIEIKHTPLHPEWTYSPQKLAQALARVIEDEHIVKRTEVQAFDFRCLITLQKINPHIATAYLTDTEVAQAMRAQDPQEAGRWSAGLLVKNYNNSIPQMIAQLGGKVWGPQDIELTQALVDQAHALGLKVVPWTWPEKTGKAINPVEINRLIDYGVDGIITDRPDILCQILIARGLHCPKQIPAS